MANDIQKTSAPDCPDHRVPMVWQDSEDLFRCLEAGCKWKARPNKEDEEPPPDTAKPWPEMLARNTVYTGQVELVLRPVDDNMSVPPQAFLRLVQQEVMIDITEHYRECMPTPSDKVGDLDPRIITGAGMDLKLWFPIARYYT